MSERDPSECPRCRGCGQIANTDEGEPWTDWAELPPKSALAVRLGIVAPIPCPKCGGSGERAMSEPEAPAGPSPAMLSVLPPAAAAVFRERARQDDKWGLQNHDPFVWLAVLTEEMGEFAECALRTSGAEAGNPDHSVIERAHLRQEAVQIAAVALAMVESLDRQGITSPDDEVRP